MAGDKTSKVFLIKSSLESTTQEASHRTKSAGKDADNEAVTHEWREVARVEVGREIVHIWIC